MNRLKLILFAIDHASARAIDRAGADWVGGDTRRARAEAHTQLCDQAVKALIPRR